MNLLIIGCGRSGTLYTSLILRSYGVLIGHEVLGRDGVASWYLTPIKDNRMKKIPFNRMSNISALGKDPIIIHQVRHPLKAIGSQHTLMPPSWKYVESFKFVKIQPSDSLLLKCMKYWYYWNLKAEENARYTYRIEGLPYELGGFCEAIERPELNDDVMRALLETTSDQTNTRNGRYKPVTWDCLENEDLRLCENIWLLASKYGYNKGESMEMKFGKMVISREAWDQARDILGAPPKKVLVFGGGKTSQYLKTAGYEPLAIDMKINPHDGQSYEYLIAPSEKSDWYNVELVTGWLKGKSYDLIICDGPGSNREGLLRNLDLFKDVPIILEDTWRKNIFNTANRIAAKTGKIVTLHKGNGKIDSWALIQ